MLSVIGIEFDCAALQGIDQFDYNLYRQLPITINTDATCEHLSQSFNRATIALLDGLSVNKNQLQLVVVDHGGTEQLAEKLAALQIKQFVSYSVVASVNDAMKLSASLALKGLPVALLTLNNKYFDALTYLLLADKDSLSVEFAHLTKAHEYAQIETFTEHSLSEENNINSFLQNFVQKQLSSTVLDTLLLQSQPDEIEAVNCLIQRLIDTDDSHQNKQTASTLLTQLPINTDVGTELNKSMLLLAGILCLDQSYRLGCPPLTINKPLKNNCFYQLKQSTSFLPTDREQTRQLLLSSQAKNSLLMCLLKESTSSTVKQLTDSGFMAQHPIKPVIFFAKTITELIDQVTQLTLLLEEDNKTFLFKSFAEQQAKAHRDNPLKVFYNLVLVADSAHSLNQQLSLFLTHQQEHKGKPWKTPVGSYFSGVEIDNNVSSKVTFVYPGIGSIYIGMGRDLLRLFPRCYQSLLRLTDNLHNSLQDNLVTPRLIDPLTAQDLVEAEHKLREKLANIAEAGVSYACLLTTIFQQELNIKASSAAGYSMGEVSMFAALGCWQQPYLLSKRLKESEVFNQQLSGELQGLDSSWLPCTLDDNKRWDSFHIKAGIMQVSPLLAEFPRVYVTIINTSQSLVIAGAPEQCLALAKQLGVRAISVDIQNIIHCSLAKAQSDNIQALYSLPVNTHPGVNFYSSSCYLPVPVTQKALAVSISKCLTEQVDFPRLIQAIAQQGESVFVEMGAGKSLSSWIDKNLKEAGFTGHCIAVNQKNVDDYSMLVKAVAQLISLGQPVDLQPFFSGSIRRTQTLVENSSAF